MDKRQAEALWIARFPANKAGRAAIALMKKSLHPHYGMRVYRRPVQDFGRSNKKRPVRELVVYLYYKVTKVTYWDTCSNCGGEFHQVEYANHWTITKRCNACTEGKRLTHEFVPREDRAASYVKVPSTHRA